MADPPITITGRDGQQHQIGPDDPNYATAKAAAQYATAVNTGGGGGSAGFLSALAKLQDKYPSLFPYLVQHPDVMAVFSQSLDQNWSDAQFQSKLQATHYYQTTTQDQRNWDLLTMQDPSTAAQRAQAGNIHNAQIWQTFAPNLTQTQFQTINQQAIRGNWSDDTIKAALVNAARGLAPPADGSGSGDLGANMDTVKQIAASYAVPVSDDSAYQYALNMVNGTIDQNGVTAWAKEQAASLFPALKTALDSGLTVDQYASPYKQIAQQELGINPNTISWTDPKWQAALSQVDPKSGARTSLSLADWTTKLRSDPVYGYDQTQGAKNQAVDFATKIGQAFGRVS